MKPTKEILISYLYEELDEATRIEVENALKQNIEAQKELELLQESRSILQEIPTKKPTKTLFMGIEKSSASKPFANSFAKNTLAIAASLALLFMVAYLTNFRLVQNEKGFEISFGKIDKPEATKDFLDKSEVEKIVAKKLEENTNLYEEKLNALQVSNSKENIKIQSPANTFSKAEVEQLLSKIRKEDLRMMKEWLVLNNQEQNEQIAKAFKTFAEYWEEKRQKDLQEIGEAYNYLKEQAYEKFKENDMILTRLIESKK